MFGGDDFLGGLGSGVGSALGAFLTNDMNRTAADHAADRTQEMAWSQMGFQERMSNTAYQRATRDMKAAGINPMVAFQQGGASTPSGAMGSGFMPKLENPLGAAIASAMDYRRLKNELRGTDAQIALNQAATTKTLQDAMTGAATAKNTDLQNKNLEAQLKANAAEAAAREKKATYDLKFGDYDALMSRASRESGTAYKVLNSLPLSNLMKKGKEVIIDSKTGEILNP